MGEKTKMKLNEPSKAETGIAKKALAADEACTRLRTRTDAMSDLDSRQTGLPFLRPHTLFIMRKMNGTTANGFSTRNTKMSQGPRKRGKHER